MQEEVHVRFAFLNVEGLVTKRTNKLQSPDLLTLFQHNDIIMFNETWTSELSDIAVANFDHIALHRRRKQSAKRDSGGLTVTCA